MNIKTSNTILYCERWQETVAFYKTQLKLPVTTSHKWFVEFELNSASRLSIADKTKTSMESSSGKGITITMEVDDIKMAHNILSEAGVNPGPIKDHIWGARVIHIFDPEGHRIEFWSS